MVMYEYDIYAVGTHGGRILLRKDLENKEEAQQVLAQIVKHVSARKTRFVSLGDVVFDPSFVMAYEISECRLWEREDCDRSDEEKDYETVTVIDMEGAETTETVEDAPQEGAEEVLI